MNKKNTIKILLVFILLLTAVFITNYYWHSIYNEPTRNNRAIPIKKESADLNNNSLPENYALINGQLSITENANLIWQSPTDWHLDNFVLADSNNDSSIEINMSVWKAGNFGSSKPFWIKKNDLSIKNHFFVFGFIGGTVRPLWQSSNLEAPNCEFMITDFDGDKKNDLVVIEGDYAREPNCPGDYLALWKWNGWGFSNEWRSQKENYPNLQFK